MKMALFTSLPDFPQAPGPWFLLCPSLGSGSLTWSVSSSGPLLTLSPSSVLCLVLSSLPLPGYGFLGPLMMSNIPSRLPGSLSQPLISLGSQLLLWATGFLPPLPLLGYRHLDSVTWLSHTPLGIPCCGSTHCSPAWTFISLLGASPTSDQLRPWDLLGLTCPP